MESTPVDVEGEECAAVGGSARVESFVSFRDAFSRGFTKTSTRSLDPASGPCANPSVPFRICFFSKPRMRTIRPCHSVSPFGKSSELAVLSPASSATRVGTRVKGSSAVSVSFSASSFSCKLSVSSSPKKLSSFSPNSAAASSVSRRNCHVSRW